MKNETNKEISFQLNNIEQLKQNNYFLRSILESPLGINIFSLDRKYNYTFYTESHKQTIKTIWGVDIHIGMNMLDIIRLPGDRAKAKKNFDKVIKGRSLILEEDYGDSKLLRTCWENRYNPIYDDKDEIVGLTVFVTDISERKRTEGNLKESESRFRSYFDLPLVGIAITSPEKNWRDVNAEICKMLGYSKDELLNMTWTDITHPEDLNSDLEQFKRIMAGETNTYSLEKRFVCKDGKAIWTNLSVSCVRKDDGTVDYLVALLQDIHKHKQTEGQLRKLTQAIEQSPATVVITDLKGDIEYVNPKFFETTGFTFEEAMGKNPRILKSEETSPEEYQNLWTTITSDKEWKGVFHNKKKSGELYWELATISPIRNDKGEVINYLAIKEDITDRKVAEDALRESEKRLRELNATKDKFFSIIAHDLRSPFSSIIGFSNLIEEQVKEKDYEEVGKYAKIIQSSSKRVMDLLTNLLEWSSSQTGRMEYNPEYVELVSLINEVIELSGDTAHHKSITITKILPRIAPVQADKAMISTVLRNLISNAIKYSNTGGTVIITAEQKEKEINISVSDKGIGINNNDIDKLFRIDKNFTTPGTDKEKGTGLGLLLCKEFIEAHGGKIFVESQPGKGSTFTFTIPVNS